MEKPKKNREGILKKRILTRDFISETPYKIHGPPREPYPCVMTWLGSKARGSVRKIKIYWGPYRKESELSKNIKLGYNPDSFYWFFVRGLAAERTEQNRTSTGRRDRAEGSGWLRHGEKRERGTEREGGRERELWFSCIPTLWLEISEAPPGKAACLHISSHVSVLPFLIRISCCRPGARGNGQHILRLKSCTYDCTGKLKNGGKITRIRSVTLEWSSFLSDFELWRILLMSLWALHS